MVPGTYIGHYYYCYYFHSLGCQILLGTTIHFPGILTALRTVNGLLYSCWGQSVFPGQERPQLNPTLHVVPCLGKDNSITAFSFRRKRNCFSNCLTCPTFNNNCSSAFTAITCIQCWCFVRFSHAGLIA